MWGCSFGIFPDFNIPWIPTLLNCIINLSWRILSRNYMAFIQISGRIYVCSFRKILRFVRTKSVSLHGVLWGFRCIITCHCGSVLDTFPGNCFVLHPLFRFFWSCFLYLIEVVVISFCSRFIMFIVSSGSFFFSFLSSLFCSVGRIIYTFRFTYSVVFLNWNFLVVLIL